MDSFYLNLAVYLLEDFLKGTTDRFYAGSFEYGRPMKGHGWMPMNFEDLVRMMGDYITQNARRVKIHKVGITADRKDPTRRSQ